MDRRKTILALLALGAKVPEAVRVRVDEVIR